MAALLAISACDYHEEERAAARQDGGMPTGAERRSDASNELAAHADLNEADREAIRTVGHRLAAALASGDTDQAMDLYVQESEFSAIFDSQPGRPDYATHRRTVSDAMAKAAEQLKGTTVRSVEFDVNTQSVAYPAGADIRNMVLARDVVAYHHVGIVLAGGDITHRVTLPTIVKVNGNWKLAVAPVLAKG
jgi:hypothetical protein